MGVLGTVPGWGPEVPGSYQGGIPPHIPLRGEGDATGENDTPSRPVWSCPRKAHKGNSRQLTKHSLSSLCGHKTCTHPANAGVTGGSDPAPCPSCTLRNQSEASSMAEVSQRGSAFPTKQARGERRSRAGRSGDGQAEDRGRDQGGALLLRPVIWALLSQRFCLLPISCSLAIGGVTPMRPQSLSHVVHGEQWSLPRESHPASHQVHSDLRKFKTGRSEFPGQVR